MAVAGALKPWRYLELHHAIPHATMVAVAKVLEPKATLLLSRATLRVTLEAVKNAFKARRCI